MLSWRNLAGASAMLTITTGLSMVMRIGSSMVLTRLLAPNAFGLVGVVGSIFFIVQMLTDLGFQTYVVRHPRGDERSFLDSIWTIHATRGFGLATLGVALAWPASLLLGKPDLAPLLAVASLTFAIDGSASLALISAIRVGRVARLSLFDFGMQAFQAVASAVFAIIIGNAWALIAAMLAMSCVRTLASYLIFRSPRHRITFDRALAGDLWGFSRLIMVSSMLSLVLMQTDRLVLARLFTLTEFGIYAIAGNIAVAPSALASNYATRILYPAFSARWREAPERIREGFYAGRGAFYRFYMFAAGGLIGTGMLVVRILYDPRYERAGLYLSILAITAVMAMPVRAVSEMFNAIGRPRGQLMMNIVRLSWLCVAVPVGYLAGSGLGLIVAMSLIDVPAYLYGVARLRTLGVASVRRELAGLVFPLAGIAVGAAVTIAATRLFPHL